SIGMTGASNWASTVNYDNLGRLTSCGSGQCCAGFNVHVTYAHDSAGNLTGRSWGQPGGAEGINHATTPTTGGAYNRTASTSGFSVTWSDTYPPGLWGRIFDTPSVGLTYNAIDEVTSVVEKAVSG